MLAREREELGRHDRAHGVHAFVVAPGVAATVTVEAGERLEAARFQLTENIQAHDDRRSVPAGRASGREAGIPREAGVMHRAGSRRGPLRAAELAEAVVLADLTLVLSIVGQVLPFGGALLVIAVVPMAAIAARNRVRAVVVGAIAASTVGFLVLGTPVVANVISCAAVGAVVGGGARRGWGLGRTIAAALFLWPLAAAVIDGLLWLFAANRKLVLVQMRNSWHGARQRPPLGERPSRLVGLEPPELRSGRAAHGRLRQPLPARLVVEHSPVVPVP